MTYPISADKAYFTAASHGSKIRALTGPFESHAAAEADLDNAMRVVRERYALDMQATFATFGVILAPRTTRTALGVLTKV